MRNLIIACRSHMCCVFEGWDLKWCDITKGTFSKITASHSISLPLQLGLCPHCVLFLRHSEIFVENSHFILFVLFILCAPTFVASIGVDPI